MTEAERATFRRAGMLLFRLFRLAHDYRVGTTDQSQEAEAAALIGQLLDVAEKHGG